MGFRDSDFEQKVRIPKDPPPPPPEPSEVEKAGAARQAALSESAGAGAELDKALAAQQAAADVVSKMLAQVAADTKQSNELSEQDFLNLLKVNFGAAGIRHTNFLNKKIKKVALCGGSGSFLLKDAIKEKADVFITGDFKYHQFFESENKILIADIGHYESEQYTIDLISDFLMKKFTNFAIRLTTVNTNPINYL